jgi:hypothetical protein
MDRGSQLDRLARCGKAARDARHGVQARDPAVGLQRSFDADRELAERERQPEILIRAIVHGDAQPSERLFVVQVAPILVAWTFARQDASA